MRTEPAIQTKQSRKEVLLLENSVDPQGLLVYWWSTETDLCARAVVALSAGIPAWFQMYPLWG